MNRRRTLLPPPPVRPAPMPAVRAYVPQSGEWRSIVETTVATVAPKGARP